MSLEVRTLVVGPIQTNCYVLSDGDECFIIDPGAEPDRIIECVAERSVKAIVLTHRHWDHIGALSALVLAFEAPVWILDKDGALLMDSSDEGNMSASAASRGLVTAPYSVAPATRLLEAGETLTLGDFTFEAIATPGHTIGSMCLYCESAHLLISGDTLFANGSFGRTDLPTGSVAKMEASLQVLAQLPDETIVMPGHGPSSTIGAERKVNPYLHI